jgi:PPP family 3-phenylpropionic acid transporter
MAMVTRAGTSYGRQRLFGSLGFVVASYSLGQLVTARSLDLIFWVQAILFGLGCGGLSLLLPLEAGRKQIRLVHGLRILAQRRSYLVFLAMNVLMGMGAAGFITFVGLQIMALGGSEQQVGLGFALNSIAEIPVMFVGGQLLARFSLRKLIVVPLLVFSVVYVGVALAPTAVVVLSLLPLLGLSYGIFLPAVVTFASKAAPAGLEATGQALMGAAQGGLGWALGALLSGFLWDVVGDTAVFLMAAVAMAAAALIFLVGLRAASAAQRDAAESIEM